MNILETSPEDFQKLVKEPFSVFDSVAFCALNERKVSSLKHLVFNDGKNRFGLITGIKDKTLLIPFSAPYACFSEISKDNKMASYSAIAPALVAYAKKRKLKKIRITFPPSFYDENHIAKLHNSFYVAGFSIAGCDINYHYDLSSFDPQTYEMEIDPKARQKLRAAQRNELMFERTTDIETAYQIIQENREAKGYPLWMSLEDIRKTIRIVPAEFFLIKDKKANPIAASMVYITAQRIAQVIYWGNKPDTDELKPMNLLAFESLAYFKSKNMDCFDIGPSSAFSIPNYGLCDFKQAIGCQVSTKLTFEKEL